MVMKLQLIDCTTKKRRKRKFTAGELSKKYFDMSAPAITKYCQTDDRWALMKGVYCLIRSINYNTSYLLQEKASPLLWKELISGINAVVDFAGMMTPREFLATFPPRKSYEEWDNAYRNTMDLFNGYDMDTPMDEQTTDVSFLLFTGAYQNTYIHLFDTSRFYADDKAHGGNKIKELFAFLADKDIKPMQLCKDENGKEFFMDSNGKTHKVCKDRPSYLRVVK
jgi:hypothetical protein